MREIRVAASNTIRMLDSHIALIEDEISILDEIEKMDENRLDIKAEKQYKNVVRKLLINEKKDMINTIRLENKSEKSEKS